MTDIKPDTADVEELSEPMTIGVDAYISPDYARAERDRLWRKVWQQVGRVEELPEVGSYLTYDILDDSIIVVRTAAGNSSASCAAHHNVCMLRGRRLIDTPEGAKHALGRARKSFVCGFHGWTFGLDGACTHIREQDDWKGALTPKNTHLAPVRVEGDGSAAPGQTARVDFVFEPATEQPGDIESFSIRFAVRDGARVVLQQVTPFGPWVRSRSDDRYWGPWGFGWGFGLGWHGHCR